MFVARARNSTGQIFFHILQTAKDLTGSLVLFNSARPTPQTPWTRTETKFHQRSIGKRYFAVNAREKSPIKIFKRRNLSNDVCSSIFTFFFKLFDLCGAIFFSGASKSQDTSKSPIEKSRINKTKKMRTRSRHAEFNADFLRATRPATSSVVKRIPFDESRKKKPPRKYIHHVYYEYVKRRNLTTTKITSRQLTTRFWCSCDSCPRTVIIFGLLRFDRC